MRVPAPGTLHPAPLCWSCRADMTWLQPYGSPFPGDDEGMYAGVPRAEPREPRASGKEPLDRHQR